MSDRPPDMTAAARARGDRKVLQQSVTGTATSQVYSAPRRYCAACLTAFMPRQPSHRVCERCYTWHRIGRHIALLRRRLAAVRI